LGLGTVLWALIPLLSLGLLAPVPFAMAAVRLRQRRMWVVTAVYAIGSALVIVGAFGPDGGWGETLVGTVILLLMVAGTTHAFLLRGRVFTPSPTTRTARRPRWLLLVASIGMLLLGVGIVAAGVHGLVDNLRPVSAASRRADGVVIRIEWMTTGSGSEQRTTDHPVVRFLTTREEVIVFTSSSGGGHSVGDSVKVRYDPNHPDRARLDSVGDRMWGVLGAVVLLLGGLVVMFWGGVLFVSGSAGTPLAWRTVRSSPGRPWRGG
jgi:multisubunit Na+/H+ antiporter MnhB subunit